MERLVAWSWDLRQKPYSPKGKSAIRVGVSSLPALCTETLSFHFPTVVSDQHKRFNHL